MGAKENNVTYITTKVWDLYQTAVMIINTQILQSCQLIYNSY